MSAGLASLFLAVGALAVGGTAAAQELDPGRDPGTPASARAGCYDLRLGDWAPEVDLGPDSLYVSPPPRIRLDTIPASRFASPGHRYRVEAAPGALPSVHRFPSWAPMDGDSVSLVFTNGFSGVAVLLDARAAPWRGTARTFWDFERPVQTTTARAIPVPCDAPLRPEHRLRYRYPRGIAIAGGDSLRLGDPVPAGRDLGNRRGERIVHVEPAPPFEDVAEIRVAGDDAVRSIRLFFPPGMDHDAVVERLTGLLGPATSDVSVAASPDRTARLTLWSGRLVSISASNRDAGNGAEQTVVRIQRRQPAAPRPRQRAPGGEGHQFTRDGRRGDRFQS